MTVLPFSEWLPDTAPLGSPGLVSVKNALPGLNSYKPIGAFTAQSTALDTRPRGAITVRDNDGIVRQFAGDTSKLYERVGTTWTDRSIAGGYNTDTEEIIEMVQWKNKVISTNFSDFPQQVTLGAATFSNLSTDFRAKHVGVVGDFLVFANTFDTTDDAQSSRVRRSAINDETDYTVSQETGADFVDLQTGGRIQRVIGGEFGLIVSETAIHRMTQVSSPEWFQFDRTLPEVGALASGAVAQWGDRIYTWTEQGFYQILGGGTQALPIGANKVDTFARNDLDAANRIRISSVVDPKAGRVYWAYPGAGNTDGRPNKILVYDYNLQRWSLIEIDVELIWRAGGSAFTLEDLDSEGTLETITVSFDSERWKGDAPQFAVFGTDFKDGFFDGSPMTAEIDTQETEFFEGHKSKVNGFRVLVDGGSVSPQVITRNDQADAVTVGSALTKNVSGQYRPRTNARYHRFRSTISGDWTEAIGVQYDREDIVQGARR